MSALASEMGITSDVDKADTLTQAVAISSEGVEDGHPPVEQSKQGKTERKKKRTSELK